MSWKIAKSLDVLRTQINNKAPNRNKTSDGVIGDTRHSKTASDHNPNSVGDVCAMDITHDPANGFDAGAFAETQRRNPHPQLKYMIFKGRIASRKYGWTWRSSSGHDKHIHISVGIGSDGRSAPGTYGSIELWDLGMVKSTVLENKGVTVSKQLVFSGTIKLDDNGNGYSDVYHSEGKDPIFSVAVINGNNPGKEGYPKIANPALLTSHYDGNTIKVTCLGGVPLSGFGFKVQASW